MATRSHINLDRDIVAINNRHIVEAGWTLTCVFYTDYDRSLLNVVDIEGEFGQRRGRNTSPALRIALETAVAAASHTARRTFRDITACLVNRRNEVHTRVCREVALGARPDAARNPDVGNGEGSRRRRGHLPASDLRGNIVVCHGLVCEETWPIDVSDNLLEPS